MSKQYLITNYKEVNYLPIITRFSKGEIYKFGTGFYRVLTTEKFIQKFDNNGGYFNPGSQPIEIADLEPVKNNLVHVNKMGINGFIECQLFFPERTPRGAVSGAQRFNFRIGNHQNPFKFTFFVPETVPPFIDFYNPKLFPIRSEIWFFGWLYEFSTLGTQRPRDEITNAPLPYTEITNFVPSRT